MERYFDIYLNAGNSVPVVINANQYDASETWIFTLYTDDNQQYTPQNGSIVGLKSDGKTIANAGTVNGDGQVVIAETEQMTACAGINIFELILNGNHGTANFVVLVEPRPGDNATPSDSDLSLMQEAIEAASTVGTVGTLADKVTNLESQMEVWLTEHAGMSNETILWEGRLTGTGSVELSEDASQFDTIAVYTQATSYFEAGTASEAHYYKASDLIANHAVVSVAVASTVSSTAIQSAIITGVVGISGTQNKTFNLIDRKGLYWTGTATDDAGIILGSSDSALITKVVGIRNEQTDAEVVAARVGSDGTQYNNLKARLDAENSDLKSAIDEKSGGGVTIALENALKDIVTHIGSWTSGDAQTYIEELTNAFHPPVSATSISLNKNSLSFAVIGSTQKLTATVLPSNATDTVVWSSSNSAVVSVSSNGTVTSTGYGSAVITATAGSVSATCSISVASATLNSITATYTQTKSIYETDSLNELTSDLVVTASWSNGTTSTVSSNEYTLGGTLSEGTSTISVSYSGKMATFDVTVSSSLVASWDFTQSLTDSVNGRVASLDGGTRDSNGITFKSNSGYCDLGNVFGANRTVEIDIANASVHSNTISMIFQAYENSNSTSAQMNFGYHQSATAANNKIGLYCQQTAHWGYSNKSRTFFDGKIGTIKITVDVNGNATVYYDGTNMDILYNSAPPVCDTTKINCLALGKKLNDSYTTFYNITYTGVRVYAGVR